MVGKLTIFEPHVEALHVGPGMAEIPESDEEEASDIPAERRSIRRVLAVVLAVGVLVGAVSARRRMARRTELEAEAEPIEAELTH